jgi:hypothetical protein
MKGRFVVGTREHSHEPSGYINGEEYLTELLLASQEGLCSMQLVT